MTTKRNMGFMFMVYLPQTKFINGSNKILIYFIDPYHSCVFAKRNYRVLVRVCVCVCVCVCVHGNSKNNLCRNRKLEYIVVHEKKKTRTISIMGIVLSRSRS